MTEAINKATKTLKQIINKIKKTSSLATIQSYELNYKLIMCLVILKEFRELEED